MFYILKTNVFFEKKTRIFDKKHIKKFKIFNFIIRKQLKSINNIIL